MLIRAWGLWLDIGQGAVAIGPVLDEIPPSTPVCKGWLDTARAYDPVTACLCQLMTVNVNHICHVMALSLYSLVPALTPAPVPIAPSPSPKPPAINPALP